MRANAQLSEKQRVLHGKSCGLTGPRPCGFLPSKRSLATFLLGYLLCPA